MTISLGLDIGSNSVGSAWVDTEKGEIHLGVSVFQAGVEESEDKRGAPKNQARRQTRSQRRNIRRRAERKRELTRFLMDHDFVPREPKELQNLYEKDPWQLRRKALTEPLSPQEFARIVIHLAQRRGAVGVESDPDDPDEGKVKDGMDRLREELLKRYVPENFRDDLRKNAHDFDRYCDENAITIGRLMADLIDDRRFKKNGATWNEPIRNRQYRIPQDHQLFAGRDLIRKEFHLIVKKQRSFTNSELAPMLTNDFVEKLDDPRQTAAWRHSGLLFGQRNTYWDTGTLGRCVLEPTERCVPRADRHASYFRVVETVNNIRIQRLGEVERPMSPEERSKVIALLRGPLFKKSKGKQEPKSSASVTDIKQALGINPRDKTVKLNIEADEEREINTDWFHREIVHGVFTEARWESMAENLRESVNRAILKFDPDQSKHAVRLREGAGQWWGLDDAAAERLVEAWRRRPALQKRMNLSRTAILNLLPIMERFDAANNRWPTQQEARKVFAKTLTDEHARRRYETGAAGLSAADRRFMRLPKHQIAPGIPELPPAPMLSNPVVRKAVHEVRRHLMAYLRKFRRKPDRVVIEFARGVKDTAKQRNAVLAANREREKERKSIEESLIAWGIPKSNWEKAVLRVRLSREQNGICPFSLTGPNANRTITEQMAAEGTDVEIEHIVPEALAGKTMAFNNLVLCFREANRGKGMRTPLDWLGPDAIKEVLRRLEKAPLHENRIKWKRLQASTSDEESFRSSQLTDTAYAARQVAAYVSDALFDGQGLPERGGERRIYTTKGEYTARLRADWGLHESVIDRVHGLESPPTAEELTADPNLEQSTRRARKQPKDRSDHRHHAVDALAIAMVGPELLTEIGRMAREDREYKERTTFWPRRKPVPLPSAWGTPESFHARLTSAFENLIVSHRPVKRRLVGALHEDTHYGPVVAPLPLHRTEGPDTLFTNRISADRLAPNHLRVPAGWDEISAKLDDERIPPGDARALRRELAAMPDPCPEKSGIVRDRALRDRIRKCLRANGMDPDGFTANQIKQLVKDGGLTMKSGVPIKGVILLRTNADPVLIPRKKWHLVNDAMMLDPDPRTHRVYIGGNNHHVEIRERKAKGKGELVTKWNGKVVSTFDAARRLRPATNVDGTRPEPSPAVDRSDNDDGRFVMSLAEGETIFVRRKDRPQEPPDYFVVCKLDKAGNSCRIHFAPHWDARKAGEQDRWSVTPGDLRNCGPEPSQPPYKVRVGPLGDVKKLEND
jgi:CRISPR-associated endonuclease Csn1